MADVFDEVFDNAGGGQNAFSGSTAANPTVINMSEPDVFDDVFDNAPMATAPVSSQPSWGQAAGYVGKNIVAGLGNMAGLISDYGPGSQALMLPPEARPSSQFKGILESIFGSPTPEASGLESNLTTRAIGGAAQGSIFPGGAVVNALGGAGAVIGAEKLPEYVDLGSINGTEISPIVGGLAGGIGAAVAGTVAGRGLNTFAGGVEKAGKAFERSSTGTTARNYIKSQKDKGLLLDTEADEVSTRLSRAINEIGDDEGYGILRDPTRLALRNKAVLEKEGAKIGQALEYADSVKAPIALDITSPQSATQKLINSSYAEKADIKKVIEEVKDRLFDPVDGWDGTVVGLNKWKTSFGNTGFSATIQGTTKPAIERQALRAVYKDIDNAVEKSVVGSGAVGADDWNALLKKYSNHKEIEPVLNYGATGELGSTYDKVARGALRTSGGILTTPTLIGASLGGTAGGPIGLAVGAGLGALSSPTGAGLAGSALKVLGRAGKVLTSADENNLTNLISKALGGKKSTGGAPTIPPTGGSTPQSGGGNLGSLLKKVTGGNQALGSPAAPGSSPISTFLPSQVTSAADTSLPSSSRATTISSSTDTVKYLPSSKYSPDISAINVLSDSDFISHYNNTIKALPELQDFIKKYADDNPVVVNSKKIETAAEKIVRKNKQGTPYTETDLGDLIRGSIKVKDNEEAIQTLAKMQQSGQVVDVADYVSRPNIWGYKGININVKTPSGAIGEVQLLSPESEVIKKAIRPLYEKHREGRVPYSIYKQSRKIAKTAEESFNKGKEVGAKRAPGQFQIAKMADGDTFDVAYPIVEAPVSKLKLSKEVPNFKAGANERGVVEELQGDFERRGLGPIAVWERKNGDLEVISGRHRWDLAVRTNQKSLPAQIYKESEGFTAQDARRLDAELNILSENGSIADYSRYFRNSDLTEAQALKKGLISRSKGKAGYAIGKNASEEVYSLNQSGKLSDAEALAIVKAAPGDNELQRAAIAAVNDGVTAQDLPNFLSVIKSAPKTQSTQGELFGHDNSAVNSGIALSKAAANERKTLTTEINAVQNAAKNPEIAKKYDIDVKDPAGVSSKVKELKLERDRWEEWSKHPDLMERLKKGLKGETGAVNLKVAAGTTALGGLLKSTIGGDMKSKKEIETEIDADPFFSLAYELESGRGKYLKNPTSSASGPFQMINATAKAVGVNAKDDDFSDDLEGMKKLKAQYLKQGIDDDPISLYAAHYLGVPTLKKWLAGEELSKTQQKHVDDFQEILIPRAQKFLKKFNGQVKA